MAFLRLHDGIGTKDLSYLLGMAISSLNEMLAKLEKSGYITREPSEQDKRVILIKLTEKGSSEKESDTPAIDDIFVSLSEEEQKNLGDYLDRIIAAMEKRFSESGDETFEHKREAFERFGYDSHGGVGKNISNHFFGRVEAHGPHWPNPQGVHGGWTRSALPPGDRIFRTLEAACRKR